MSGVCTGWVVKNGPRNVYEFTVLTAIADAANVDGENSHPGMKNLIHGSRLKSERGVQGVIRRLIEDGWIEITEEGGGRGKATVYRVLMKPRIGRGENETPQETKPRRVENETPQEKALNPAGSELLSISSTDNNGLFNASRLCNLLADLIEANGSKRPVISQTWISAMERLNRLDKKPWDEIEAVLRWAQKDEFWQANILSAPKFREKYDQLRLQMNRRPRAQKISAVDQSWQNIKETSEVDYDAG